MKTQKIETILKENGYVGRGVLMGMSPSGKKAAMAYFIMGRSENSQNRVFIEKGEELVIHPFDESKVEDPSLIIYAPVRVFGESTMLPTGIRPTRFTSFLPRANPLKPRFARAALNRMRRTSPRASAA